MHPIALKQAAHQQRLSTLSHDSQVLVDLHIAGLELDRVGSTELCASARSGPHQLCELTPLDVRLVQVVLHPAHLLVTQLTVLVRRLVALLPRVVHVQALQISSRPPDGMICELTRFCSSLKSDQQYRAAGTQANREPVLDFSDVQFVVRGDSSLVATGDEVLASRSLASERSALGSVGVLVRAVVRVTSPAGSELTSLPQCWTHSGTDPNWL